MELCCTFIDKTRARVLVFMSTNWDHSESQHQTLTHITNKSKICWRNYTQSNEPASMQFLFHKLLASLKTPEEDHNGHQGFATLAIDRNVLVNFFVYKVTKSNNALLET